MTDQKIQINNLPAAVSLGAPDLFILSQSGLTKKLSYSDFLTFANLVTSTSLTTFTNKSGLISQWTNDANYISVIAPGSVTNTMLAGAIDAAKIANGSVSNTEFQYLDGVGSNIQTQINALAAAGYVVGPGSSTDNAIARFDLATGKVIQNSSATIDDSGNITATSFVGPLTGNVTGNVSGSSGSTTGNAATVTTNANLTGAITSAGNATSLGSFTSAQLAGALTNETGSGSAVFGTAPTITGATLTTSTVNGVTLTTGGGTTTFLNANGAYSTPAGSSGITVGTTTITSGTTTRVLYDNAGVVGEYTISGTGNVAMTTSPTFVTPILGAASGTSLNLSGLTASSAVATDGSKNLVSVTNTGSGNNVLATSPTLVTPALGTPSSLVLTNATGLVTAGINASQVTLAKIQNAAANSKLLGAGAAGSGSAYTEITLGTNLSMSGTTLNATGGGGGGSPGGSDTQVQYNSSGSFAADALFTRSVGTNSFMFGDSSTQTTPFLNIDGDTTGGSLGTIIMATSSGEAGLFLDSSGGAGAGAALLGATNGIVSAQVYALITGGNARLLLSGVPTFATDALAVAGGLSTGMLYKTTTAGSTLLKIVP